jgi:hypothetical protein
MAFFLVQTLVEFGNSAAIPESASFALNAILLLLSLAFH